MKIKTIDITGKEWFDRVNGNSYFSAQATINFGMKTQKTIRVLFQYGYGESYEHETFKALQDQGIIKGVQDRESPWRYYERLNIIKRSTKHENCLKRDVIAWGSNG